LSLAYRRFAESAAKAWPNAAELLHDDSSVTDQEESAFNFLHLSMFMPVYPLLCLTGHRLLTQLVQKLSRRVQVGHMVAADFMHKHQAISLT
jgi:hypothetical protein